MALSVALRAKLLGSRTARLHQANAVAVPRGVRQSCIVSAAAAPHMVGASKYAILRLGGVRQMLQEGFLYSCPKHFLLQREQQDHFSTSTSPAAGNGTAAPAAPQPHQQQHMEQVSNVLEQRSFVLSNVLGLHNGEQFTWGSPYLPNTLVEVELVEEFQGPRPLKQRNSSSI